MPSRLRRHDEYGHLHFTTLCCVRRLPFFRYPVVCSAFERSMQLVRADLRVRWIGYVIMPEHVHLLMLPQETVFQSVVPVSTVLHQLKGRSGKTCKDALRDVWRQKRSLGDDQLNAWANGDSSRFWKPRGHDFNVVTESKVLEKLEYMHQNPLRRKLVDRPEQWCWSSYRFYETGDSPVLAMDWDGSFPIVP